MIIQNDAFSRRHKLDGYHPLDPDQLCTPVLSPFFTSRLVIDMHSCSRRGSALFNPTNLTNFTSQ